MEKKSQDELEKPAKVYQMDAISDKVDNVIKLLEDQSVFLKGAVTIAYMEERLKNLDEKFKAEIKSVRAEYRPTLQGTRWATRTAITAAISIMLLVLGIYLKS